MTAAPSSDSIAQAVGTSGDVVRCMGLTKIFKDFWLRNRVRAVDKIDLDIHRGELFGLLGPNGSGKSTTIKMILGLLNPTAGRISVFGKRAEDVATKKMIGYLPEESYLYRFLNARETLDYYGRLFYQNRHQRKRRVDMLLEMVGLEAVQRRPIGEYSKGMQRRIGLAQALINDPHLLILDEPTTGLDPIGTRQIKDLLLELKSRGKTILLCSHLLSDVEDVCDRVAIMYGGKVRQRGTVDELLTVQDKTVLETSHLDEDTINEIRQVLIKRGHTDHQFNQPRQKLESLFLDIVHQAQEEGVATAGAQAGGRIAEFLSDEHGEVYTPVEDSQDVLDSLTAAPAAVPEVEVSSILKSEEAAAEEASQANSEILRQLSMPQPQTTEPQATPSQAPPEQTPKPKGPVGDKSVLDGLTGDGPGPSN